MTFRLSMNSYRRGPRNGVLVNLKLFLLEKVKLGQLGQTWSTWSNLVKLVLFGTGRYTLSIVSDRDSRFTSRFWKELQSALCTRLNFSTAFHPQTDGQSERLIQVLEDMLRGCVMEFTGSWDRYIPLIEFAYNNSYQSSIGMAPYEALYGRRCRTPVYWT